MVSNNKRRPAVSILLVEDDEIDVEALGRALRQAGVKSALHSACDGVEALAMLRGTGGHKKLAQPCLILLDINVPRMSGVQFLKELRGDEALKRSVVFILTTSGRGSDRLLAYEHNVAGYFLKENLKLLAGILHAYCQGNEFPDADLSGK